MAPIGHPPRWTLPTALLTSGIAHAVFALVCLWELQPPGLDLELQLPSEIEFGLTESVSALRPPATAPALPPPSAVDSTSEPATVGPGDAGARDASAADAGSDLAADARRPLDAGAPGDAGGDATSADGGLGDQAVGSQLPPGAQIAVRIDMERIRNSPLAQDVAKLLAAIPDWTALLEGSGIDPVQQLDRLLLATPNLERSRIVIAGRYQGGREAVERAVQRLAQAQQRRATWRLRQGVPVAPWANKDATERVVALIGPQHFSISREEDLPRLLAIAAARQETDAGLVDAGADSPHPAEALLSMQPDEGLSLEVEGVRQFVRRGHAIPAKLRLSAIQASETTVLLKGRWVYDDAQQAEQARAFWDSAREAYARATLVALLGLSRPLEDGSIVVENNELRLSTTLSARQMRLILGYLREWVAPPPPLPPLSPRPPKQRSPGGQP